MSVFTLFATGAGLVSYGLMRAMSAEKWPHANETEKYMENSRLQEKKEQEEFRKQEEDKMRPKFHYYQPDNFEDYIGQTDIKEEIKITIANCKRKGNRFCNLLLCGGMGLGKTSLVKIIAKEMGVPYLEVSAAAIDNWHDMANEIIRIHNVQIAGSILFIDEIHLLDKKSQTSLYNLLIDEILTVRMPKTKENRTFNIIPLSIIGATTHKGALNKPLIDRFDLELEMKPYSLEELKIIVNNSVARGVVKFEKEAIELIARRCRQSPRQANRIIKRILQREQKGVIVENDVVQALLAMGIHADGMESSHISVLYALYRNKMRGRLGMGVKTLSGTTSNEEQTLLNDIEPYLKSRGYIDITGSGRALTPWGEKYLKTYLFNPTVVADGIPQRFPFILEDDYLETCKNCDRLIKENATTELYCQCKKEGAKVNEKSTG